MAYFRLVFAGVMKVGCKFPKFHLSFHYYHFYKEYGAPALTYSGWWEKAMRFLVKMPYLRTGRQTKGLEEKLVMRVVLADRVRRMVNFMERARQKGRMHVHKVVQPTGEVVSLLSVFAVPSRGEDPYSFTRRGFDEDGYIQAEDG